MESIDRSIEFLLEQFGKNPYGGNIYRIVWSEDVLAWEYGRQVKFYGENKNRWILEKWQSPEKYDREWWKSQVMRDDDGLVIISPEGEITYILGPFPEQGLYEHCYTFEGLDGQFCPLSPSLVSLICQCIEKGAMKTEGERLEALKAREEKKEQDFEKQFNDIWKDSAPGIATKLPDHCERITSFDVQRRFEKATKGMPDGFSQISAEQAKKLVN